ncbi:MAG: hypothetical protein HYR72_12860 [Deltaproteobacteria bacterium]|nr:hypothetical protein [Deltaproteobacteria bacterium]MBI3390447.1 hypothetical protein [Deltaproteobacteria bacterium]
MRALPRVPLVVVGLVIAFARAGAAITLPHANTLGDLCPGTPNPCVVSGKFAVSNGVSFNAFGRAMQFTSKAALVGDPGASFIIGNTSAVAVDQGAVLSSNAKGAAAGSVTVYSGGACAIAGKVAASATADALAGLGGNGGSVVIWCHGISLAGSATVEAKGAGFVKHGVASPGAGGAMSLNAFTGAFSASKGAKINAQGKGAGGGFVGIASQAACTGLATAIQVDAGVLHIPKSPAVGGDGGGVNLSCSGDVSLTKNAKIVTGTVKTAHFGAVVIDAGGSLQLDEGMKVQADGGGVGPYGVGTAIDISSATNACTLNGKLQSDSQGAAGGAVQITCAGLTLGPKSTVEANNKGDTASNLFVDTTGATTGRPPASCNLSGKIALKASAQPLGFGASAPGTGGALQFACGTTLTMSTGAAIDVSASGGDASGGGSDAGSVDVKAAGAVFIGGKLTAKGTGTGGTVTIVGLGITVTNDSGIDTAGASGGDVLLNSQQPNGSVGGDIVISKTVSAKGSGGGAFGSFGGVVAVEGCSVTIDDKGSVVSDGTLGGQNAITAHKNLVVAGKISAHSLNAANGEGGNALLYRNSVMIADPTHIVPATTPTQDMSLMACP